MKGELTQSKVQLEKLYSNKEKLDEQMLVQRPTYDKTGLGYLFNMFAKKIESGSNLKEKDKSDDKIESSQSSDKSKEVGPEKEIKKLDEPKKIESPKETSYEFRDKKISCNEIGHMKRDYTNKSFNHVMNFYCHNCHAVGHKEIDCKKPKYDNDKKE